MGREPWLLALGLLIACGGDKTTPTDPTGDDDDVVGDDDDVTEPTHTGTPPVDVPNYADAGVYGVTRQDATFTSVTGDCTSETATYLPDGVPVETVVVVAHNTLRDQEAFADLATHLASWGIPTITANLCASGPGAQNVAADDAADLVALAAGSGADRHLFLGHVTGGVRAILAANGDGDAAAVIGLDLVEEPSLTTAADAAAAATVPLLGLTGLSTTCNLNGNGAAVYAAASDGTLLGVDQADTCDFEWSTTDACRALCARPEKGRTEAAIQRTIHGMITAGALWQLGVDPLGEQYWVAGGQVYDDLVSSGALLP
jgi:hypothetical protein